MDNKNLKILVCSHKRDICTRNYPPYYAIQVGKSLHPELNLGYLNDNSGVNISEKNSEWCELTALYWGWKNINDASYKGLCHYRRYIGLNITDNNIESIIGNKEIIIVNPLVMSHSNMTMLETLITKEDYYILIDTLLEMYPEYRKALIDYGQNSNCWIPGNIFISKSDVYDSYCSFLFPLLEAVQAKLRRHPYWRLNRSIAYMGEFLLGIFITQNKLRVKKGPLIEYDEANIAHVHKNLQKYRRILAFKLLNGFRGTSEIIPYQAVYTGFKIDGITSSILSQLLNK